MTDELDDAIEDVKLTACGSYDPADDTATISGTIKVGEAYPHLFITTPDRVRKEIRRIEYVDPKHPTWQRQE